MIIRPPPRSPLQANRERGPFFRSQRLVHPRPHTTLQDQVERQMQDHLNVSITTMNNELTTRSI